MRIRDSGWKNFGSGMKKSRIRDREKHFKILKFFYADPRFGMEKFRIRDEKKSDPGSGKTSRIHNTGLHVIFVFFTLVTHRRDQRAALNTEPGEPNHSAQIHADPDPQH